MVDPPSFHHHHLRPLQLNSLLTTCNYPARHPSPLLRDVGPIENAPRKYRNTDPSHIRPSPLQRDVGSSMTLDGRNEHKGKPKQCEAHLVRHKYLRAHMLNADILLNTSISNKTPPAHPHHGHINYASMRERGPNNKE